MTKTTTLEKTEERYYGTTFTSDYETFEIVKGNGGGYGLKVIPYTERWRSPEDSVKYLEEIIKVIKDNFLPPKSRLKDIIN